MKEDTKFRLRELEHIIREFLRARKTSSYTAPGIYHPDSLLDAEPAIATNLANIQVNDKELVKRIIVAYQKSDPGRFG